MRGSFRSRTKPIALLVAVLFLAACGSAATPSPSPTETPAPSVAATVTPELTSAEPAPTAAANTYAVKSGDTLIGIAAKHGITLKALQAANPQVTDPRMLQVGQQLVIPSP
jgi:LysM repeat protein